MLLLGSAAGGSSPRPVSLVSDEDLAVLSLTYHESHFRSVRQAGCPVGPPLKGFQPPGHTGRKIVMSAPTRKDPKLFVGFIYLL